MIDTETFWNIIKKSIQQKETLDKNNQGDQIMKLLTEMSNKDMVGFQHKMQDLRDKLDNEFMQEIAFMKGYNNNPTAYRGFRSWIISLGEEHYNKAIKSPAYLLTIDDPNLFVVGRPYFNDLDYVGSGAFYEKNGLDSNWDEQLQKYDYKNRKNNLDDIANNSKSLDNDLER